MRLVLSITSPGFTTRNASYPTPHASITPGVYASTSTSAQRTRSTRTPRASGVFRSRARPSFPQLKWAYCTLPSGPKSPRSAPPPPRAASGRTGPSTLTTVAPKSASTRVISGPAYTHDRSSTFSPDSGGSAATAPPAAVPAVPVSSAGERRASPRMRAVSAPTGGGAGSVGNSQTDDLTNEPGQTRPSTSSQYPRDRRWSSATSSAGVTTG